MIINFTNRSVCISLAVALAGLLVSAFISYEVSSNNDKLIHAALKQTALETADKVKVRLQTFEYGLRGARGLYASQLPGEVTLSVYRQYAQTRDIDNEFAGARGFGFIRWVRSAEYPNYPDIVIRNRGGDFQVKELSPNLNDRFVIEIIEPESRNKQAVGLDIASEANRRNAALRAARSGRPALTDPITLVQASGAVEQGFLLLMPLYASKSVELLEADKRLKHTVGWSYTPLVISEVLAGAGINHSEILFDISNVSDTDKTWQTFYHSQANQTLQSPFLAEATFEIFGRKWRITAIPGEQLISSLNLVAPKAVFVAGMLLSTLAASLFGLWWANRSARTQQVRDKASLSAVVRGSADGIFGCDDQGRILWANAATSNLLGLDGDILTSMNLDSVLIQKAVDSQGISLFNKAVMTGESQRLETEILNHTTSEYKAVLMTCTPVKDDLGLSSGIAVHLVDIGEQKKAQQLMADYQSSLEAEVASRTSELELATCEAEKANLAKSEFLANMSHEIRTPLSAIMGLSFLLDNENLNDTQRDWVHKIKSSGKTLLSIINNVLDLSKIEAGEMAIDSRPFDLAECMAEIETMFTNQASSKGLKFNIVMSSDIPNYLWVTDETRIKQVLMNLVGNAIKFTSQGAIGVKLNSRQLSQDGKNRYLTVDVTDTGIGIEKEALRDLFMPFKQVDSTISRRFGGTGLGLSIVRQLVEKMGGSVSAESVPGLGSTFTVGLPCQVLVKDADDVFLDTSPAQAPLQILLVMREIGPRQQISDVCKAFGWRVYEASSAEELTARVLQSQTSKLGLDCLLIEDSILDDGVANALHHLKVELGANALPGCVLIHSGEALPTRDCQHKRDFISGVINLPADYSLIFNEVSHAVCHSGGGEERILKGSHLSSDKKLLDKVNVLLVDDNRLNIEINGAILRKYGATVQVALDGQQACDKLKTDAENIDIVLMDMQMPVMDGCTATLKIRNELGLKDLPIIALTAGALSSQKKAAISAGMTDFLTKPLEVDRTCLVIRKSVRTSERIGA